VLVRRGIGVEPKTVIRVDTMPSDDYPEVLSPEVFDQEI
jgi:hypothetical protein